MFSFPKSKRLQTSKDFQDVFRSAKKCPVPHLVLYIASRKKQAARIGLAISKKQIPKAVRRNQVKRIIRESFRLQTELDEVEVIAVATKSLNKVSNQELRNILNEQWKRLVTISKKLS